MPRGKVQVWSWVSTTTLAPPAPNRNGPLEYSRALAWLGKIRITLHRHRRQWTRENPIEVLDRGMDINSQWNETDLVANPEQRRKEGWYVFTDTATWADCNTPLHMAMSAESTDTVALLLSRGADINSYNARGQTMLYRAVCRGSTKWIEFLLRHGMNPNIPTVPSSVSCWFAYQPFLKQSKPGSFLPLSRAILDQRVTTINMLLEHGADVNQSVLGWWPLELAVLGRDREIVGILLANGAHFSTGEGCVIESSSSPGIDSKQDEDIAKGLAASSKRLPEPEARQVFDKVIVSESIDQLLRDGTTTNEKRASDLVATFFDILSRIACTVNPDRPSLPHCDRCVELQSGPAFRGNSETWTWGRIKRLIQSASGGCPVCNLLLDAVKHLKYGEELPTNDEDEVHLNAYQERWEVRCGDRVSTIQLRPIFDYLMMRNHDEVTSDSTPDQTTYAPAAFEIARRWLEHCESTHSKINGGDSYTSFECPEPPKKPPCLPTRVIYVGEEGGPSRLLESNGLRAPYCALSYCWGNTQAMVSTRASISGHLERIPVEVLPKTPREAIFAARQLGFQYIWIDALCIVQDDEEDWEREAARMQEVYYNARLVLCASDSDDYDGGLFRSRKNGLISPVQLTVPIPPNTWPGKTCMYAFPAPANDRKREDSPVDSRAWTLQERILSPRILYFGADMLRWECLTVKASETDPDGMLEASGGQLYGITCRDRRILQGRTPNRRTYQSFTTAAEQAAHRAYEASLPYKAWEKMIAEYSSRAVTKSTDRIPAILGLGRRLEAVLADEFVAGVWKGTFGLRSLCWTAIRAGRPVEHYPSWSWASTTSPVHYSMLHTDRVRDGLVTWHASPPEFDVEAHGSQHVVQGSIRIRGIMKPAIENLVPREKSWGYNNGQYCTRGVEYLDETFLDHKNETSVGHEYLIMASIASHENLAPRVVCMLVKPVDGARNKWQRIGMCSLEDGGDLWANVERDRVIYIV